MSSYQRSVTGVEGRRHVVLRRLSPGDPVAGFLLSDLG